MGSQTQVLVSKPVGIFVCFDFCGLQNRGVASASYVLRVRLRLRSVLQKQPVVSRTALVVWDVARNASCVTRL